MSSQTLRHPVIGDEVVRYELNSGLTLYVCLKPCLQQRHAILSVDYGSADANWLPEGEESAQPAPHGVAHFLEHRLFEKCDGDITSRFTSVGADVDAHTTFTSTAYSFTCGEGFHEALDLLLELVLEPYFSEAAVRREREIITHEIELYEDSVDWVAFSALMRCLYGRGPMGDDIAGTPESLSRIDARVLESCYATYYGPDRMSLVVAGDLEPGRVARQVESFLESRGPWPRRTLSRRPVRSQPRRQTRHLPTALPRLLVAADTATAPADGKGLVRLELCLDLGLDILVGPSSDFYHRHYQSGLVDDETFGYEVYCEPAFTFCVVGGDTPDPARLEAELARQLQSSHLTDLIEASFERSMRRSWGHLLARYEDVEGCAAMALAATSRGAGVFDYFSAYDGLEAADVVTALKTCMASRPWGVATVLPRGDGTCSDGGPPEGGDQ